jgi:hypothetical protein
MCVIHAYHTYIHITHIQHISHTYSTDEYVCFSRVHPKVLYVRDTYISQIQTYHTHTAHITHIQHLSHTYSTDEYVCFSQVHPKVCMCVICSVCCDHRWTVDILRAQSQKCIFKLLLDACVICMSVICAVCVHFVCLC